jgi:hypothetical protein
MSNALKVLNELGFTMNVMECSYEHLEFDNSELHDLLNDECTEFQEIAGQDTWSFEDGSYVTRLVDDYFLGDDISLFEIEAEL